MSAKLAAQSGPKAPDGLDASGRELWLSVVEDYELEAHERLLLLQACRCVDRLDRLAVEEVAGPITVASRQGDPIANPALVEARQQSLAFARMLASLRLPSGEDAGRPQRRGAARGSYGVRSVS